jgi:uncharacterized protein YdcH (DUF465 family)
MTLFNRLMRTHARIDRQIAVEQASASADWAHVTALKKSKLRIKDMLARMQRRVAPRSLS